MSSESQEVGTSSSDEKKSGFDVEIFLVQDPLEDTRAARVMLWKLQESFLLWVSPSATPPPLFPHLVSGMVGRFDGGVPMASTVCDFGGIGSVQVSHGVAKRLAKRTGQVVHVCCSLDGSAIDLLRAVEARVVEELGFKRKNIE